jgi:hypothetical protein
MLIWFTWLYFKNYREQILVEIEIAQIVNRRRHRRRPRRYWARPWLSADRSLQFGDNDKRTPNGRHHFLRF